MQKQFPVINYENQKQISEGVQGLKYPDILPPHFITLIVGKPGSGKSILVQQLILQEDLYFKKFNDILFITPSKFEGLDMSIDNWIPNFDLNWIRQQLSLINKKYQKNNNNQQQKNILIVLDDIISEIKQLANDPQLSQLIFNRRHLIPNCVISFLITTQKYTVCPPRLRNCLTAVFLFQQNKQELKKIIDELIYLDTDKFQQIYEECFTENKFNFIYILLNPYGIFKNFKKIL